MKPGNRVLISGNIYFGDDPSKPFDVIVTTIESNIPQNMYCNHVLLGNAFFSKKEPQDRGEGRTSFVKIGSTLDNSDVTTWLFMEVPDARKRSSVIGSVQDAQFVFKGICANIVRMILRILIGLLSQLISRLAKISRRMDQQLRLQALRRGTDRSIRFRPGTKFK